MEPTPAPPIVPAATTAAGTTDSVDSSPRSRNTDSMDDSYPVVAGTTTAPKLRLMCSFGGHIVPRPHAKSLCYIGGETRIVVVDRHASLSDLAHRLSKTLLDSSEPNFTLKYQLPNEDLDSLISVTTDEDLDNMIDEYDRLNNNSSGKSSRLRLFLFPSKPESISSIGSLLENSTNSEDWFLNALNGTTSGGLSDSNSVNCLLGLDDDAMIASNSNNIKGVGGTGSISKNQDVHSVPDSPMLDTTSSFGSASSSPSLGNLPPIKVHAVEDQQQKLGIEEQFSQLGVGGNANQKSDDGGFVVLSSPPPTVLTAASGVPMSFVPVIGEYSNRIFSDDERSEGAVSVGYRKQLQQQAQSVPSQLHQKTTGGGRNLASPDSVSSDGSITNPLSRHNKPMIYQDPNVQISSGQSRVSTNPVEQKINDPNISVQVQPQFQDSGYLLQTQYDQQHHPQLHQQQPQLIHAGAQYIQHHPTGAIPMSSYYPVYPSQQPHHPHHPALDQHYPVYYVPARQPQAYNVAVQQPGFNEATVASQSSRPQAPPPAAAYNTARNVPSPRSEMAVGVYRTATTTSPSLVEVPSNQHQPQYVGLSQIQHPSQSIAPTSTATANYAYEFADPTHAHMYYTQPLAPQMAAQYQTMTSALPEVAALLPTDSIKQQVRTSQA